MSAEKDAVEEMNVETHEVNTPEVVSEEEVIITTSNDSNSNDRQQYFDSLEIDYL